ncbi:MAG: putative HTH-type transcriptional regulator [Methanosaeta sp. PtaB.Bin039]|nr:MAG: putative HTH-type transcriptional regulator [Methanosaeta sp. PtaB.Bin039]OPY45453.1 MAG: putative HTH-type transcriptional regulator [Methanosaeta sp. PtaU1.Bin028]HOT06024.1 Lrp/AsnC family transcriptional regulator [Methanotrichaceae archaeon]HQF16326.1 Lrp/AsnC family transcriptional regulator [Methanotrichaceae archaeon]HQI90098.1 Lrp/AsnC family transcriptional regulator [Methanotrichaceae archaeon]
MNEILQILSENSKATPAEIAALLGQREEVVAREIKELEDSGVIRKYMTLIDWEKAGEGYVYAVIELKVALQRNTGYDAVAERIARFSEVQSVRLISGDHDLSVTVRGKSMREVAFFVAERIAILEGVQSTCTHFILKSYKEHGVNLTDRPKPKRLVITA